MYCGSHIHFSPIDNKPLCSYSIKLCKQRRINGYAFCIRHILEDKSAPFKQCVHVAKYNQQKCSNAIPANEERHFCNSHMQIAGITPKKERKDKRANNNNNSNNNNNNNGAHKSYASAIDSAIFNNKCNINAISISNNSELKSVNHKLENLNAFVKLAVKLNGNMKKLDKCGTSSQTNVINCSTTTSVSSSHLPDNCNNSNSNTNANNNKRDIKRSKRKKKDKTNIEKFVFARKKRNSEHLFNYHIWSSSDDEDDTDVDDHNYGKEDLVLPSFATHLPRIDELEANELKNELTTQKWLLSNLIKMLQKDLDAERKSTCSMLSSLKQANGFSYIDHKLRDNAKRSHSSITKGICCYTSDESSCSRPSLPYSRHCSEHILYNVDQLLFSRCTAKCAETLTQCLQPTFDITREEPLCLYHQSVPQEMDFRPNSPQPDGKSMKRRKKTKPMALTRVSRRGKKRRKAGADCISLIEDNSIDKNIVEEVIAESNVVDKINLLPSPPHSSVIEHIVVSSLPQSSTSSTLPLNSRPLRLPQLVTTTPSSPVVVMGTHVIPHPPPLEPIEEAFVASIVADLPQLSNDADFTEVLNKIPDDAFSEFLLDHQNGGPSTEETEALEQALAMVNKDMQNMVAAAVNGSTSQTIDLNGQSDILGFSNWLGNLTTEQRQQLNGLIDGAIASNSLSPILKTAYETFPTPVMKSSTASVNNNMFSSVYPLTHTMSMQPTNQEFVPISTTVPLLTNSLLMNGLSSHPS